jgi:branched-subunit amino acid ABC-type transport system permease component
MMFSITSPQILFQLLVNGILFGAVYAIAAIGLSIIFGTMKILFFAQGTMIILAAYGSLVASLASAKSLMPRWAWPMLQEVRLQV